MNESRTLPAEGSVASTMSPESAGYVPTIKQESSPTKKKRPGPKRDAKPALSEKLERNRQAQRTHRERKEQYTKDLEAEVMRLKELFVKASQERDAANQARDEALGERNQLLDENHRLRERLNLSGTDSGYSGVSTVSDATRTNSFCMSDEPAKTAPTVSFTNSSVQDDTSLKPLGYAWGDYQDRGFASDWPIDDAKPVEGAVSERSGSQRTPDGSSQPVPIDYDELGLDFVLTLERPCMGHLQYLTVRAHNCQASQDCEMAGQPMEVPDDGENQHISGHALMFTAPPPTHIQENPGVRYPATLPKLQREDLLKLLDLSSQLQVNEPELPPVKAWIKLMQDDRFRLLSEEDFAALKSTLLRKVHCYRFGAVVEEGDITNALQEVLDSRMSPAAGSNSSTCTMRQI